MAELVDQRRERMIQQLEGEMIALSRKNGELKIEFAARRLKLPVIDALIVRWAMNERWVEGLKDGSLSPDDVLIEKLSGYDHYA